MKMYHVHVHVPLHVEAFNDSAGKGKQMVIGGTKSKASSQSGYFEATFKRVLTVCLCMYNVHVHTLYIHVYTIHTFVDYSVRLYA